MQIQEALHYFLNLVKYLRMLPFQEVSGLLKDAFIQLNAG